MGRSGGSRRAGPTPAPIPRGTGRLRRDRRALRAGGEGVAGVLNQAVGGWPHARVTPMFGRWGYFLGGQLFGCYPIREKDHDLWVRLAPSEQARALAAGARPHRRFPAGGWVECDVADAGDLGRALGWLRRAYEGVRLRPWPR